MEQTRPGVYNALRPSTSSLDITPITWAYSRGELTFFQNNAYRICRKGAVLCLRLGHANLDAMCGSQSHCTATSTATDEERNAFSSRI